MAKNVKIYNNDLINACGRVLASTSDRFSIVGGQYNAKGWFLAAHDTVDGVNAENRVQVWLHESGGADIYIGVNRIAAMTKASRDRVERSRSTYGKKSGFKTESKLVFRGDDALEQAYSFLESIKYKSVAKKSNAEKGVA